MKMKKTSNKKEITKPKTTLGKIWYFIWHDDSLLSWIVNIILAFLIVNFIFYPLLSLISGTSLPLVAVISPSMEHRVTTNNNVHTICGKITEEQGRLNIEKWWEICGNWYEQNTNITLQDFREFPLKNGFNKGDIILLKSPKNLEVGDVLVFQSGKQYPIIHRIININETIIQTKGDNNPNMIVNNELNEQNISHDVILGKAYAKVPYLGYIKIWFTDFLNLFR